MTQIILPNEWEPRDYQLDGWEAWQNGDATRLALAWHRRAGKDDFALHGTACKMMERVGTYWHMLPEASQARKAIWEAVNPRTSRRRIDDGFPKAMRDPKLGGATRESDMFIRAINQSTWQVVGSDNFDSLVGSPPVGVVFSEYALADPNAWAMLRPILDENGGWAVFISTFRGRNHFQKLVAFAMGEMCKPGSRWFGQILPVGKTKAIPASVIAEALRELEAERGPKEAKAVIDQEYHCDPDAAIPGTYYAEYIQAAEREGRISRFAFDPMVPVQVSADLGVRDGLALWFVQLVGLQPRVIDFQEFSGVGLEHVAKALRARPYIYAKTPLILPHDARQRRLGLQVTTPEEDFRKLGYGSEVLQNHRGAVYDRIHAARKFLPTCWINTHPVPIPRDDGRLETQDEACERMQRGIVALRQYRREWNEELKRFDEKPLHDWCSDPADSFGYMVLGVKPQYHLGAPPAAAAVDSYSMTGG